MWIIALRTHTTQQDGHSCGVLVMHVSGQRLRSHPNETTNNIAHNDASRDVGNLSRTAEIMSNDTGALNHEVQTEMTCQNISELEIDSRSRIAESISRSALLSMTEKCMKEPLIRLHSIPA